MNQVLERIVRAVAKRRVTRGIEVLAEQLVAQLDARAALPPPASVAHHDEVRRQEELQAEEVSAETWAIVLARTARDHRLRRCCEACHKERPLEPHHLVLRERTDAPHLVMALCSDCHRLGRDAAHRQPRRFAVVVVIPWAQAHHYPLPNRKEYRP